MIAPRPSPTSGARARQSQTPSASVATRVKPSSSATPSACLLRKEAERYAGIPAQREIEERPERRRPDWVTPNPCTTANFEA